MRDVRYEIAKPQPRLKGDRQSLLQRVWDYAATSARCAPEVKPGGRRWDGHRASVPDQLRDRSPTDSAPSDHVPGSVRKSSPNRDRVMMPESVVWAPVFQTLGE